LETEGWCQTNLKKIVNVFHPKHGKQYQESDPDGFFFPKAEAGLFMA